MFTTLEELKGFEEPTRRRRSKGNIHKPVPGRTSWLDDRTRHQKQFGYDEQPYCLVIGGGQSGITMGARLKRLGVPTLIIDKHSAPGDAWRDRYNSLCLHDPVWYDHLPYIPFPDDWPIFSPKDKLADWLEMYTRVQELDFWGSTECVKAEFDETANEWRVEVLRDGEPVTLRPKHVVFAVGLTGKPITPQIPGADTFQGEQYHSGAHRGGDTLKGKRAVVIGARNSAFDMVLDLWEHGCEAVTMVQRSSTHIVKSETLRELLSPLYSEDAVDAGLSAEEADFIRFSVPFALQADPMREFWVQERQRRSDYYDALEKTGFMFSFGEDESGLTTQAFRTGRGFYIDEGTTELLVSGDVKVKKGAVTEIREHSVIFDDGTELAADIIVYATGYDTMTAWVKELASPEIADQLGRCWGYGAGYDGDPGPWEGELRNISKPTAHPNLWVHGGGLGTGRFYSKFLALQLKARYEKLDTPVYKLAPVHHLR
nr:NAD(P)/FAD-dependent oxidoreductase [Rhodococcus sp. ACPA4]